MTNLDFAYLKKVSALFAGYMIVCQASLWIQETSGMATQVWPAAGLALFAVLMWGPRMWPAFFFGTLAVHLLNGHSPLTFLGPAIGNTIEPLLGAYFCKRMGDFHHSLDRFKDVVPLFLGAGLLSTALGSLVGVPSYWYFSNGSVAFEYWLQHWIGDASGVILVAPLLLVFSSRNIYDRFAWKNIRPWEWLTFNAALLSAITLFSNIEAPIRLYFFFPLLLWSAMRLGQRGATVTTFIISSVSIWYTTFGAGPFGLVTYKFENEFFLFCFVTALAGTGLAVAAVVSEREAERKKLLSSRNQVKQSNKKLEVTIGELENARDAADIANKAKTAFLANMSHEIRTPLGIIMGFSDLILSGDLSAEERAEFTSAIQRNGRLLGNIINDILDLSKVEAGLLAIHKSDVLVSDVISDIQSEFNSTANTSHLDLKVRIDCDVPTSIKTDPLRLRQIVSNIMGNATKFTNSGSIEVGIRQIIRSGENPQLAIDVKDTGIGIAPAEADKLFSPFTQVDVSATRHYGGTGLGLALSRKLARSLGGNVVLTKSELGKGSTFTITIEEEKVGKSTTAGRQAG